MWATPEWIGNDRVPDIPPSVKHPPAINENYSPTFRRTKSCGFPSSNIPALDRDENSSNESNSRIHGYTTGDQRIVINISGKIFETRLSTLQRYPNTLLGSDARELFYDSERKQYFFDRNRSSFTAILLYYQSKGKLHRPFNVPFEIFQKEIDFFDLGNAVMQQVRHEEGLQSQINVDIPKNPKQRYLWLVLNAPESTKMAKVYAHFSMLMIMLSVMGFCLETLPVFTTYRVNAKSLDFSMPILEDDVLLFTAPLFVLETICVIWFTVEIIARLFATADKIKFFHSFLNWTDILSVLPYYINLAIVLMDSDLHGHSTSVIFLRAMRLIRVLRIFTLSRHCKGLQILGHTMLASCKELTLLLFFVIVCVVLFASLVYYAELDQHKMTFSSIPDAFWWAVVTMTTVGYGDMHPETALGKFVGCVCAIAGVLTIALPVPIIVSNFNYFYSKQKEEEEAFCTRQSGSHNSISPIYSNLAAVKQSVKKNPSNLVEIENIQCSANSGQGKYV